MRIFKLILVTFGLAIALPAQQSSASPVQTKRLPSEKTRAGNPISTPFLDRYDFGAQISALQSDGSIQRGEIVKPIVATPVSLGLVESGVPPGFRPKTDVQLTPTAQEAVQMSEKWMA